MPKENNKINRILRMFYEYPEKEFTIREIAKLAKIPKATVHQYMAQLKKQKLITKDNRAETNLLFKTKKINYYIEQIASSGLIEELVKTLNPSCIILFGSVRKGDSVKESDIDLFIEASTKKAISLSVEVSLKKAVSLKIFEKQLGHKIQLFVEPDIKKLHSNLLNNVVNGIKLYGSFTIT